MKLFKHFISSFVALLVISGLFTNVVLANGIYTTGSYGNDFSYPQCNSSTYPTQSFNIVGVTSGRAFQYNSCFSTEYSFATGLAIPGSVYMNLNAPIGTTASNGMTGPYGNCSKKDKTCQANNYGYNAASDAYTHASQQGAMWWLDIETGNSWFSNTTLNRDVIDGAVKFFANNSIPVGIYSTDSMWNKITGKYHNGLPTWVATSASSAPSTCPLSFTGGTTYLVQYNNGSGFDADYACQ